MSEFDRRFRRTIERLRDNYPTTYEDMVDWYPSGGDEITIRRRDGSYVAFNAFEGTLRYIHDPDIEHYVIDEEIWRKAFGARLINTIRRNHMTQRELSDVTGISQITISKYIQGKATPTVTNLVKIAQALKCSVSYLSEFIH